MDTFPPTRPVRVGEVELAVRRGGEGDPIVLVHGWPHTSAIWHRVWPRLTATHDVIAFDLRGTGASSRPASGHDAASTAADIIGMLDVLEVERAAVVAIDAGVPGAFVAAARHPDRIERAALIESLLMPLPGAEDFLRAGPPWWFGFHAVPGLAERVLAGAAGEYISHFLRQGLQDPSRMPADVTREIIEAYSGVDRLRGGFEYYRAAAASAAAVAGVIADGPVTTPILAVGGDTVGDALARQLGPVATDLTAVGIPGAGHIVPIDQPDRLTDALLPFLRRSRARSRRVPGPAARTRDAPRRDGTPSSSGAGG